VVPDGHLGEFDGVLVAQFDRGRGDLGRVDRPGRGPVMTWISGTGCRCGVVAYSPAPSAALQRVVAGSQRQRPDRVGGPDDAVSTPDMPGWACSIAWKTFSVAACASATFSRLILERTISTFIVGSFRAGVGVFLSGRRTEARPGDSPGVFL